LFIEGLRQIGILGGCVIFVKGDMRKFEEIRTDCLEKTRQQKQSFVDVNLVLSLLSELQQS
jgi:hypothetical protein